MQLAVAIIRVYLQKLNDLHLKSLKTFANMITIR